MKKLTKNTKKGIAIELATFLILIMVTMSTLIVSVSILGVKRKEDSLTLTAERFDLQEIGDEFLYFLSSGNNFEDFSTDWDSYTAFTNRVDEEITLMVKDSSQKTKLLVKLKFDQQTNHYTVIEWKY